MTGFYVSRSALCPSCRLPHPVSSLVHHISVCRALSAPSPLAADSGDVPTSPVLHGLPGRGDGGELVGVGAGSDEPEGRVVSPKQADHPAGSHVRPTPTPFDEHTRMWADEFKAAAS